MYKIIQNFFFLFSTINSFCLFRSVTLCTNFNESAASSPAKPRPIKYDPTNGNQTVGPSGGGLIQRRSTRLYEKTMSNEKTSALPAESK